MTLNGVMATFRVNSPKVTAFTVNYVKVVVVSEKNVAQILHF